VGKTLNSSTSRRLGKHVGDRRKRVGGSAAGESGYGAAGLEEGIVFAPDNLKLVERMEIIGWATLFPNIPEKRGPIGMALS
jgi:hypothetical protein